MPDPEPKAFREELAALCHEQWGGWMRHLFAQCDAHVIDGAKRLCYPQWAVDRWSVQLATDYAHLSEKEKDSDRKEADKFLALIAHRAPSPDLLRLREAAGKAASALRGIKDALDSCKFGESYDWPDYGEAALAALEAELKGED